MVVVDVTEIETMIVRVKINIMIKEVSVVATDNSGCQW